MQDILIRSDSLRTILRLQEENRRLQEDNDWADKEKQIDEQTNQNLEEEIAHLRNNLRQRIENT